MTTKLVPGRIWTLTILLFLCLIYPPLIISKSVTTGSFIQGDSYYYRAVADSLLQDGDLLVANNVAADPLNGYLAIGREGLVPKHPIIMSLISMPFYILFGSPGLLLFNVLDSIVLIFLIFKLNCLFFDPIVALITTVLYATGTLFLDYVYNYSPDIFSTVLLLGGLYLVLREKYYIGAVLLGLSIFAKLPNALLSAPILLYAGFIILRGNAEQDKQQFANKWIVLFITAIIFLISLIPFAYTNYFLFGSPVVTGYQRMAEAGPDGQVISVNHADEFNQPLLKGIDQSLFDYRNGVLLTNPVLALAFLGIFSFRKIKSPDKVVLILILCLVQFLFFAKYDDWSTSHFSNRFLMTFIALSSVFTSNFLTYLIHRFSTSFSQERLIA
jgi:hypothetical protein